MQILYKRWREKFHFQGGEFNCENRVSNYNRAEYRVGGVR